jgi:hypothetical protein
MKKKETKKLLLHRETLRSLEEKRLDDVRGAGRTYDTCDISGCIECLPDP